MTAFSNRNHSVAHVPAPRVDLWAVLTDADLLSRLTPLVASIDVDGDRWTWRMAGISALGMEVAPTFTERMTFTGQERIEFRHDPPSGRRERACAEGQYLLADSDQVEGGTRLEIDLTITVELPLPRLSRRAVEGVMASTMARTGEQFGANLYRQLGLDPSRATETMTTLA